ncbi:MULTISPECIES: phospholipase D family protein [Chryseobacterium]|uniref:Phosphatidylserine/phosphatidylglycerophosphate/ cardiolipin synthase-like enzyme n=1 Tax=Chryseobacterium camelliae TaxID=1265445 RepID=A0ABU0TJP6_9FLAO|nr:MULTISPECIES: phospholipase D family protein [Chryseobacterium]MDT3408876.1 phosphatidylserine/phosphatidylglycerophosphate/cardiolipin synthase-like enzyme [Pseudacidovorax intermedius]MDQ1097267.1 phosphatidylserine/phosphatidylglycerophosphate/cardiolipin synthase-like enzyme [Chryseobacterium camelliae]MDQ1101201.1 phosphatidylserine/phosphatidylglycerophosphate/cardiolipin synthase-like enzyme [Chryseobacterium sp. SORGH_AS_1048]MDR6084647.1 phosphatidylserine/phosphatidylglycerophospha
MGTFYNNAVCDIYIGRSAGAKLIQDIRNAKKNVKIVSPYLSPSLIKELIFLHNKGIEISLITTDEIEDFYGNEKNINKLIIQEQQVDEDAKQSYDSLKNLSGILLFVMIGLAIVLIPLIFFLQQPKFGFGFIAVVLLFLIRNYIVGEIRNKKIYHYTYRQLFPFKVFVSPGQGSGSINKTFIHSKIYLIDDEIAYMGSLNFTAKGVKENYETRIRTTDPNAVHKIVEEVNRLLSDSELAERDVQYWGSQLYSEPIN